MFCLGLFLTESRFGGGSAVCSTILFGAGRRTARGWERSHTELATVPASQPLIVWMSTTQDTLQYTRHSLQQPEVHEDVLQTTLQKVPSSTLKHIYVELSKRALMVLQNVTNAPPWRTWSCWPAPTRTHRGGARPRRRSRTSDHRRTGAW